MKIAIVHEMLIKLGGAERVLQEFMKMYPEADIFTLMYDEKKVGDFFPKQKIRCTGPAQGLFRLTGKPRFSLPLMPFSVKSIDLTGYDLVISSSSGFAHGVDSKGAKHICYCHSPARYLWDWTGEVQKELITSGGNSILKKYIFGPLVKILFWWLRKIDLKASKSPDLYIANSREVQDRIQRYYARDSVILWPPVETTRFSHGLLPPSQRQYYVMTSALTPFKRLDIAIRVLSKLSIPLKIIGAGAQRSELEKIAGESIEFLGRLSDPEVAEIYNQARGFLMPQKEDAGIAPIEAMAAGIPVFGLAQGGLLETNIDGITGRFFPEETDESFERGFLEFHREIGEGKYDNPESIIEQAKKYNTQKFQEEFRKLIQAYSGG